MESVKSIIVFVIISAFGLTASAQTVFKAYVQTKTETFKVYGKCELCKTRIDKAVKEEGASTADWNLKTRMLTVSFNPAKTNIDALEKKLASVGHDTEKYRAPDDVYANLPSCCHYERAR